jgi:aspartyl/asparaginyl beta-hydroxylase (cupin superfamily)
MLFKALETIYVFINSLKNQLLAAFNILFSQKFDKNILRLVKNSYNSNQKTSVETTIIISYNKRTLKK